MSAIRARVAQGRLILDEPTSLPEGTVLDLVADDEGDDLDDDDRKALHESIANAWTAVQSGQGRSATEVLLNLQRR